MPYISLCLSSLFLACHIKAMVSHLLEAILGMGNNSPLLVGTLANNHLLLVGTLANSPLLVDTLVSSKGATQANSLVATHHQAMEPRLVVPLDALRESTPVSTHGL